MAVYSYAQLESLWINAGGPKALAPIAAAIAEAESGGNSDALNPNDNNGTQSSFGLWQISNGTHAPPSPNWADPAANAQLAVAKYKGAGNSFSPWGTYASGAYRAYLSGKTAPDPNVPGSATALLAQSTAAQSADCLVGGSHIGLLFGMGPTLPCLFTKSNARGWIGVGLTLAGGLIMLPGLLLVAASAGTRLLAGPVQQINSAPVIGSYTRAATSRASARLSYSPARPRDSPAGPGASAPS
ncbi:MAG TPA: transglycosylase SLT domain-containing protein [Stellaceae bacterium]|nr:transglycosylase SLT domain-containing protein [Stellaceae bacterium]